jgi:hypothetical protein
MVMPVVISRQTFDDEITDSLKHTGAGILSMANRYAATEPFILY